MVLIFVTIGAVSLGALCLGVRYYRKIYVWRVWKIWEPDPELYLEGKLMKGMTIILTGADSGVGKEVARELYSQGAKVILACRNEDKTRKAIEEIKKNNRLGSEADGRALLFRHLDLSSFGSIISFAQNIDFSVDMLINNAGAFGLEFQPENYEGLEPHMMVNHYGPAMLTMKMCEKGVSRIVNVTSTLAIGAKLANPSQFLKMNQDNKLEYLSYNFTDKQKYASSKLANVLFMTHLLNQKKASQICFTTPGFTFTRLHRNVPKWKLLSMSLLAPLFLMIMKTPREGAQTILGCCYSPRVVEKAIYSNCTPNSKIYERCLSQSSMTPATAYNLTMNYLNDHN